MSQLLRIRDTILFIKVIRLDTDYRSQGNPDIDSQIMQKKKQTATVFKEYIAKQPDSNWDDANYYKLQGGCADWILKGN